ncbi:cadmium resistance transporter [Rhizobium leucaenae]|uniref:Cadmium resistance protein CadD (Predicted permease) n=1 Tax=Rhizobium leucaenae TaxID=29450 RepID=A0A7W7EN56_9HYPH|nr:cadmium resistance transporter [Rhizobium leucaenae]MBB4571232.1 cadmium resistance protein CadD (predicted permease) [Rhizobium leucaenae]MBB6304855.1 cadmium resistance protein CadD (predicted permease) [Rhizobium leucaenae]
MDYLFGNLSIAIVLFASTNVDDIFVLLGFFADRKFRARQIVIGQYLGIAALSGASVLASLISLVIPAAYIGLLGLVPIFLGLKKLWALRQGPDGDPEDHDKASIGHGNIVAVAAVTIANGGDNISIYTPLFATRTSGEIAAIAIVFVVMTALWLGAAHFLVNHPAIGAPIRRYGHRVVPFVLVALGILILHEAGTVRLLW